MNSLRNKNLWKSSKVLFFIENMCFHPKKSHFQLKWACVEKFRKAIIFFLPARNRIKIFVSIHFNGHFIHIDKQYTHEDQANK